MCDNIVKRVCDKFNINQRELAEMLGVGASTVSVWSKGETPKMAKIALECMLENKELKEKLEKIKQIRDLILNL